MTSARETPAARSIASNKLINQSINQFSRVFRRNSKSWQRDVPIMYLSLRRAVKCSLQLDMTSLTASGWPQHVIEYGKKVHKTGSNGTGSNKLATVSGKPAECLHLSRSWVKVELFFFITRQLSFFSERIKEAWNNDMQATCPGLLRTGMGGSWTYNLRVTRQNSSTEPRNPTWQVFRLASANWWASCWVPRCHESKVCTPNSPNKHFKWVDELPTLAKAMVTCAILACISFELPAILAACKNCTCNHSFISFFFLTAQAFNQVLTLFFGVF